MLSGKEFRFLAPLAKYTIITLSIFMALDQLGVADTIVNAAFILILGGFALAFGLSFGLGGKEFASRYLAKLDRKIENINRLTIVSRRCLNENVCSEGAHVLS